MTSQPEFSQLHQYASVVDWWLVFNDTVLTELLLRAQGDNFDLQIASERIEQNRAQLGLTSSQWLPNVGAGASWHVHYTENPYR